MHRRGSFRTAGNCLAVELLPSFAKAAEDEARAIIETLPLAKEQLMDHDYIPVGPLMPLRMLIGPGAQQ
jgi:hypothetical protein